MKEKHASPELIRHYLLGDLDEDERDKIEAQLLTDEGMLAALSDAQDELIDDYASDVLSDRERGLFDTNFVLTPERLHKLRLSTVLAKYTEVNFSQTQSMQASAPLNLRQRFFAFVQRRRLAVAISFGFVLLITGYLGWKVYERYDLEKKAAELRIKQETVEKDLAKLNSQDLSARQSSMSVLSLRPLLRGSKDVNRVAISAGSEILQLKLEMYENEFSVYQAVIETDEGIGLYSINNLKAQTNDGRKVVVLYLPSHLLQSGSYQIHLRGISAQQQTSDIGAYPFQVVHE
jgi:hypothetical protein